MQMGWRKFTFMQPSRKLGSSTVRDVQVRHVLPWNGTMSLGINKVFEHEGPLVYRQSSSNISYYTGFDICRFMYMKYQQRF